MFRGQADWSAIARLKEAVAVPVIGNGDVNEPDDALRMLAETGCDGVMIARACLGRPWLFRQAQAALVDAKSRLAALSNFYADLNRREEEAEARRLASIAETRETMRAEGR